MYKLISIHIAGKNLQSLVRINDGASIPFDPANTDYQEYLRWLDLGNQPEPADNPPTE